MANDVVPSTIAQAEVAKMPPHQEYIHTSFWPMPIPECAGAFYRVAKQYRGKPRSRIWKKMVRYKNWVDLFATKQYQAGAVINKTMAPTWGEFDVHDMQTSQK